MFYLILLEFFSLFLNFVIFLGVVLVARDRRHFKCSCVLVNSRNGMNSILSNFFFLNKVEGISASVSAVLHECIDANLAGFFESQI